MPNINPKLPSFTGVANGETAVLNCPIGATYKQIPIDYSGTTFDLSHIAEIRVVGNGQVIQRFATIGALSGGQILDKFNQFDGRAAANGTLILDFERYGMNTRQAAEVTGLGTGWRPGETKRINGKAVTYEQAGGTGYELSTLEIQIDIKSTAVAPKLVARAKQGPTSPLGLIKIIRQHGYDSTAVGEMEIANLTPGMMINKAYFHNADVNNLKLEINNNNRFDRSKAVNEQFQVDGVRVPQAGMVVLDPTEDGYGAEAIPTAGVQDLRFKLDMGSIGSVPVTMEWLGYLTP